MRSVTLALPALCCALLLLPSAARAADPFAGFRIPDHSWQSGRFGFGLDGSRVAGSSGYRGVYEHSYRDAWLSSRADGAIAFGRDSDDLTHWFSLAVDGGPEWSTRRDRTEWTDRLSGSDDTDRVYRLNASAAAALRTYPDLGRFGIPALGPLGLDLSATLSGGIHRLRSREDFELEDPADDHWYESRTNTRSERDQSTASIRGGIGVGRVRDATALYDARLLERRLAEAGALARPLSPAARSRLAALAYVAPRFAHAHERPDRFVWQEIESILRDDGALPPRGLDAYAVLRALEPTAPVRRPQRLSGVFLGYGGSFETSHTSARSSDVVTERDGVGGAVTATRRMHSDITKYTSDVTWLGGWTELHRALGWNWQIDARASALRAQRRDEHGLALDEQLLLRWFVADRWELEGGASHQRRYRLPGHDRVHVPEWLEDRWSAAWSLSAGYYLEDQTLIQLSLSDEQGRRRYSPQETFSRSGQLSLSVTHRFLGALDVPEL